MNTTKNCHQCGWPHQESELEVCGFTCLLAQEGFNFSKRAFIGLAGFSLIILANILGHFFKAYDPYFLRFEIVCGALTYLLLGWSFFRLFRHSRLILGHFYGLLWLVSLADFLISISWGFYSMTQHQVLMRPLFVTGIFLILMVHYFAPKEFSLRKKIIFKPELKMDLRPDKARLFNKNQESWVGLNQINQGDLIKVLPGEVIPCDGTIISGTTSVNETIIFGEPSVRLLTKGAHVVGASMNRDGAIVIEANRSLEDNYIVKKMETFKRALNSSPVLFSKHVHYFLVLIPWLLVLALPLLFVPNTSVLMLVEGFVISLSLYGVVGLQRTFLLPALWEAIQKGILIPSLGLVQKISSLNAIFFDKSGTLTRADYQFSQVLLERGTNQGTFLSTVFSLESSIEHPIAKGVKTHPWYLELPILPVNDRELKPGLGVTGVIVERGQTERKAALGNMRLMKRLQMQTTKALREKVEELESIGETVLLCAWDGAVRGLFSLSDTLRSDVKGLLASLTKLDVDPIMITGDHDEMISHLHVTYGLKKAHTRCLPDEKISKIHKKSGPLTIVGVVATLEDQASVVQAGDVGILLGTRDRLDPNLKSVTIFGKGLMKISQLILLARHYGHNWKKSQKIALISLMLAAFVGVIPFSHPILVGGVVVIAWRKILKNLENYSIEVPLARTSEKASLKAA